MTTVTNFEGEVYALATTNVVTVVATDLSGNAATNNRTFTTGAGGTSGNLTYDLNGNLLSKDSRLSLGWDEFDRCDYIGYLGNTNNAHQLGAVAEARGLR